MPPRFILPAALPSIGLGYLLQMGRELNDAAQVIGVRMLTILFALVLDRFFFGLIQKRILVRWGVDAESVTYNWPRNNQPLTAFKMT